MVAVRFSLSSVIFTVAKIPYKQKTKRLPFSFVSFFVFHWTLLFLTGVVNIVNALQWNKKMRKSKSKTWAKDTPYIPILELDLFTCSSNITSKEGDSIWMVSYFRIFFWKAIITTDEDQCQLNINIIKRN